MSFKGKTYYYWLLPVCCFLMFSFVHRTFYIVRSPAPSCKQILENTIASVEKIQTLKFHLKCNERFKGKLISTESRVKLNRSPRKIYIYLKGPELLWGEGANDAKALVNPHGFPYMNLNLDPLGSIMRENQHHTVHEMGFEYFADIIKHSINISGDKFDTFFKCAGTLTWDAHECYLVTAEYPDFNHVDYKMKRGETVYSIARKLMVSDYMILEINPDINHYNHGKEGQIIKVPNVYGKKLILYIDKELLIPRVIKVYDDKGLYESYEYHDLQLNPKITDDEFTKEYKEYGF